MTTFRVNVSRAAGLAASLLLAAGPVPAQDPVRAKRVVNEVYTELRTDPGVATYFSVNLARDPAEEAFGAALAPPGDALRAQLGLPAGRGLLVSALRADGACAAAGLLDHDVLLTLADKPLASAKDLADALKAAGDAPASLKLLRAGQPVTLPVRARSTVTIGRAGDDRREHFIGVTAEPVDDALRAQLKLPADRGVLVGTVVAGDPADKAGVKPHDVVLEFAGQVVDKPDTLTAKVRESKGKPCEVKLVRAGQPVTLTVAPGERKVEAAAEYPNRVTLFVNNEQLIFNERVAGVRGELATALVDVNRPAAPTAEAKRLDELQKEVAALRAAIDALSDAVRAGGKKKE